MVHTIKHQQVLTIFSILFFLFLVSEMMKRMMMKKQLVFSLWPLLAFSACVYDECRAANPGQEEDDCKGAKLIYNLLLLCALVCLSVCSAFLLMLKCIALPTECGNVQDSKRWWEGLGGRMLLYSSDELTLLCKCQKVILSLTSFPPSNMFDEEIKIRYT